MIYVVEHQLCAYLFASRQEAERHAETDDWGPEITEYNPKRHDFRPNKPDYSLGYGPGQEKCKRLRRKIHQWWKERDAWWNEA